jgi:hypothetical protein
MAEANEKQDIKLTIKFKNYPTPEAERAALEEASEVLKKQLKRLDEAREISDELWHFPITI